jgi:teichuronic acid biosynthesis glycosyltransferase TuaC
VRVLAIPKDFPTSENPQAGIFILRRLQAMRDLGHEIFVLRIVPYAPPLARRWRAYRTIPKDTVVEGIPVRTIRAVMFPRMIGLELLPLQLRSAVTREIARVRAEIVHASYLLPSGQLAIGQDVPSVVTMHGIDAHTWPNRRIGLRRATAEVLRRATRLTAVSHFLAAEAQKIEPCDVRVIWNGADERFFFPQSRDGARRELGLPLDRLVFVYAGALEREKGLYDLIEALTALRERNPLVLFVGTGPELHGVRKAAASAGLDLRLPGRLLHTDVARMYAAADVVTLPSHIEGLPNVICEAMLCRRAIVSTTAGGVPEIVTDGRSGLLTPIGDPAALGAALLRLADDPGLRARLADEAHNFASTYLTWRKSAQRYDALYAEALQERPRDGCARN